MNILAELKRVDFFGKLLAGDMAALYNPQYMPQKPPFTGLRDSNPLPRSTPEAQGIPSAYIERFYNELSALDRTIHSTMLLRNGTVIASGAYRPYRTDIPHVTHSLCKSLTATAVGLACDRGLLQLDEKVVDILPNKVPLLASKRIRSLTVEHLLTMTSGIAFHELDTFIHSDWVKAFFESDCVFEPGTRFLYNSMNTYLLSAIVQHRTGQTLLDFLRPNLLEPMGIRNIQWETCPMGITKGGWGCYMTIESMAKLGQLYLQKGKWMVDGTETVLLSSQWIERAILPHFPKEQAAKEGGYGYQIWMCKHEGSYLFNGMFGQYTIVLPAHNMVVAITAGCDHLFAYSKVLELTERYFGGTAKFAHVLPACPGDYRKLLSVVERLGTWDMPKESLFRKIIAPILPIPREIQALTGRYVFDAPSGGILPLIMQCMQFNVSLGISAVALSVENGIFYFTAEEKDCTVKVSVGFWKPAYSTILVRGEPYRVACCGQVVHDEDGNTVLKLELYFLEISSTRKFKLFFKDSQLLLRLEETPSLWGLMRQFSHMETAMPELMVKTFSIPTETEYGTYRLNKLFAPELKGRKEEHRP